MGNYVSTNGHEGSFAIGDHSSTDTMNIVVNNSFRARFANGYRLYTSATLASNAYLAPGDNAWSTTSDVNLKENFAEINGEDFLKKIATLHLTSWNYKKQEPSLHRHYGPMAQDFFAAFGKDSYGTIGTDSTINQADFDGVNLIAIQALARRTADLKKENEELKARLQKLEALLLKE